MAATTAAVPRALSIRTVSGSGPDTAAGDTASNDVNRVNFVPDTALAIAGAYRGFVPRKLRPQIEGAIYHVTSRGNRGQPIYGDSTDRVFWIGLLSQTVHERHWICHAYCQMTNHFHLLVETPDANISDGMQSLNSEHAQWFNWRYGHRGHLFQGRFYSRLIEGDAHFIELSRYIVLNPVRAGLCARADDWRWSSHAATAGAIECPDFLTVSRVLSHFSFDVANARAWYRAFVTCGGSTRRRKGQAGV